MLLINRSDGVTERCDLSDQDQYSALVELVRHDRITALSIIYNNIRYSLPTPKRFRRPPTFGAELIYNGSDAPIGEKAYVQAENVRLSLSVLYTGEFVRCDLVKTGRMQYNPLIDK